MGNIAFNYTAKRRLKSGVTAGTEVDIILSATQFDRSTNSDKKEVTTLSGSTRTTLMYIADSWSIGITMTDDVTQDDIDQLIYSTAGGEPFLLSDDIDTPGVNREVKRVGGFSRNRRNSSDAGRFDYEFRVREVL